jgi:hypothetical protein
MLSAIFYLITLCRNACFSIVCQFTLEEKNKNVWRTYKVKDEGVKNGDDLKRVLQEM